MITTTQKPVSMWRARTIAHAVAFVWFSSILAGQVGTVMPAPKFTGFDTNGTPVVGGKLCSYIAGTTTPLTTYTDAALSVPNTNPVVLDTAGRASVFLTPGSSYKFVLLTAGSDSTCATGSTIWTQDNVTAVPSASGNVDVLATAGESLSVGQVAYLSDGSGGKTAGTWYRGDATNSYSSVTPPVGMVTAPIASSATGTIRVAGTVMGLPSLTVGAIYYLSSTTPGAITLTSLQANRAIGVALSTSSLLLNGGAPTSPANVDVVGTAGEAFLSGHIVYLSDGSGSKTAGRWYKADAANAYSSTLPIIGQALGTVAAGGNVAVVRMAGRLTNFSGLTAGQTYYVGTAGGASTTVTGTARRVGVADSTTSVFLSPWSPGVVSSEFDNGNSGTAKAIDFSTNGPVQKVTRTGNCTYTLTAPPAPGIVTLKFVHEASATAYTVTFSPAVKWPGGVALTFTNTSGAIDVVNLYWDGAAWFATGQAAFS